MASFGACRAGGAVARGLPYSGAMHPSILIVDDEEPIRLAFVEYFGALGFHVDDARELEEAEALLSNVHYDVVIADLRLTGIYGSEGLQIVGFLRERSPSVRIILLTAYGSEAIEAEARRLGVDVFLHKPQPLAEIARIVREVLQPRV